MNFNNSKTVFWSKISSSSIENLPKIGEQNTLESKKVTGIPTWRSRDQILEGFIKYQLSSYPGELYKIADE